MIDADSLYPDPAELAAIRARPFALVDVTGGVEQYTYTAPGTGEPEVWTVDYDDESDLDDMENQRDTTARAYVLMDGRSDPGELAALAQRVMDLDAEIASHRQYQDAQDRAHDAYSRRERAAALLTPGQIDAILAANTDAEIDAHARPDR